MSSWCMVAELFRRAILDDQSVHGASENPARLLLQNSYFQLLLTLMVVFTLFVFFFALRRFGNSASPFLVYVVCMITIYVAFCIKKARSSRSGVYGDESFYGGGSKLSFTEKLIAASNSDYLGKKVVYLLSRRLRSKDAENKTSPEPVPENEDSSDSEDSSFSGRTKEASENYYGRRPHESGTDTSAAKRNMLQTKSSVTSPLVHSVQANRNLSSKDSGQNSNRADGRETGIVQKDRDIPSGKKYSVNPGYKGHRSSMRVQGLKDTAGTDNKDNRTAEKSESAKNKNDFLREIQGQIQNKKRVDSQLDKFKKSIQIARAHVSGLIDNFRKDYRVFCVLSRSISDKLLSRLGISTDLYAYELEELEEEVLKKYTLHEEKSRRSNGTEKSGGKNRKASGTQSENLSPTQTTNSQVLGILKRVKDAKERLIEDRDRPQSFNLIKWKLQAVEFYLTIEGIISLILILMVLVEMYEYVAMLRFVLILALLFNIYIGMFILADGKTLEIHCQRRMLEGCKQGTHEVNKIVQLLNQNARLEHQVDVIHEEFSKISSDAKQQILAIRKYLVNSLNSRVDVKILVFETFIDKLKSIEERFDEVSEGTVDKVAFYNTVDAMKRDLENIKAFTRSMNVAKILDVYQRLFQVDFFFSVESQRVSEKIKSIIDAETDDLGKNKRQKCIDFIKGTCNSQKEHDSLSFVLVFLPILFTVLLFL